MDKKKAIKLFKDSCVEITNIEHREKEILNNDRRNIWSIPTQTGYTVIEKNKHGKHLIYVYIVTGNVFYNNMVTDLVYKTSITSEEYNSLKKIFFGELNIDTCYHKEISEINSEWQRKLNKSINNYLKIKELDKQK